MVINHISRRMIETKCHERRTEYSLVVVQLLVLFSHHAMSKQTRYYLHSVTHSSLRLPIPSRHHLLKQQCLADLHCVSVLFRGVGICLHGAIENEHVPFPIFEIIVA